MRELTIMLYKYHELPTDEAKERAKQWYREGNAGDTCTMDEICDSLKAVFKVAGIELTDWSLGAYNRNYVRFDLGDASELKGKRAIAWLENNLFSSLRITRAQYLEHRKDYLKYGEGYKIGQVKSCPLTGVCFDDEFLEELVKDVKSGNNLKDSFSSLADLCGKLIEEDEDYKNSDENVEGSIEANEYEFSEEGKRI